MESIGGKEGSLSRKGGGNVSIFASRRNLVGRRKRGIPATMMTVSSHCKKECIGREDSPGPNSFGPRIRRINCRLKRSWLRSLQASSRVTNHSTPKTTAIVSLAVSRSPNRAVNGQATSATIAIHRSVEKLLRGLSWWVDIAAESVSSIR